MSSKIHHYYKEFESYLTLLVPIILIICAIFAIDPNQKIHLYIENNQSLLQRYMITFLQYIAISVGVLILYCRIGKSKEVQFTQSQFSIKNQKEVQNIYTKTSITFQLQKSYDDQAEIVPSTLSNINHCFTIVTRNDKISLVQFFY